MSGLSSPQEDSAESSVCWHEPSMAGTPVPPDGDGAPLAPHTSIHMLVLPFSPATAATLSAT